MSQEDRDASAARRPAARSAPRKNSGPMTALALAAAALATFAAIAGRPAAPPARVHVLSPAATFSLERSRAEIEPSRTTVGESSYEKLISKKAAAPASDKKVDNELPRLKETMEALAPAATPRLRKMSPLAPISEEAEGTASGLHVSQVNNPSRIEGRPMSQAEAAQAKSLVKHARSACTPRNRIIPPCSWQVEQRGNWCINAQRVVVRQEGVTGVEIPATQNGVIVPYQRGVRGDACDSAGPTP